MAHDTSSPPKFLRHTFRQTRHANFLTFASTITVYELRSTMYYTEL